MLCAIQFTHELSRTMELSTNKFGPRYYKRGRSETWDFIRDQGLNFHLGNAIKYIVRAGHKDSKKEDLTKAIHYLQNELEHTIINTPTTSERVQKELQDWEYSYKDGQREAEMFDR